MTVMTLEATRSHHLTMTDVERLTDASRGGVVIMTDK